MAQDESGRLGEGWLDDGRRQQFADDLDRPRPRTGTGEVSEAGLRPNDPIRHSPLSGTSNPLAPPMVSRRIQPAECIDCGACEPVCPVDAIYPDRGVPADKVEDKEDNRRFFLDVLPGRDAPVGSPGGSLKIGEIGVDTPRIAAFVKPPEDED